MGKDAGASTPAAKHAYGQDDDTCLQTNGRAHGRM